jgi:hypothetical protein
MADQTNEDIVVVDVDTDSEIRPRFEYVSLPPSVAVFLKNQADRIRRSAAASIINIGKDLLAAKHYLSHGRFLTWVEREVGMPPRTAQAYMQVAHWASRRSATVALLPPSLLYLLAAPSTPTTFVDEILKRVQEGQLVEIKSVRSELRALRSRKREGDAAGSLALCRTSNETKRISDEINCDRDTSDGKCNAPLIEAISIFVRTLSRHDFVKVRDLLTSKSVLEDPKLPQSIEAAFWIVEKSADACIASDPSIGHVENAKQHENWVNAP